MIANKADAMAEIARLAQMVEQLEAKASRSSACSARFVRLQSVKFPLGDGTYQECTFIGVDSEGVATVKTKGGRYRTVWDCNLYPQNAQDHPHQTESEHE